MTGIYVHIPFCVQKCLYCDFPSYGGISSYQEDYVAALCREIGASSYAGREADTLYFGGGTPSLLTAEQVGRIMAALRATFSLGADAEITLEANPDSMEKEYAKELAALGINRVSLGVQSFCDETLRFLRRIHTAEEAVRAVEDVYAAGIGNISVDLIYGLPGQSVAALRCDMETLLSLPITHSSLYSLIVEAHTPLERLVAAGKVTLPSVEEVEAAGTLIREAMAASGFVHYEISAYCRPGYASRHNIKYWTYEPYIGFGASAHSFDGKTRFANESNIPVYIKQAGKTSVVTEREDIDTERGEEDYCFLALRMRDGIDGNRFRDLFGRTVEAAFGPVLPELRAKGFLEETARGYKLTKQGLLYGNYVFGRFLR